MKMPASARVPENKARSALPNRASVVRRKPVPANPYITCRRCTWKCSAASKRRCGREGKRGQEEEGKAGQVNVTIGGKLLEYSKERVCLTKHRCYVNMEL